MNKIDDSHLLLTGIMDGVDVHNYNIVRDYMLSVDFDLFKTEKGTVCILPVIRQCLCWILDGEYQTDIFKQDPIIKALVMDIFDVEELANRLDLFILSFPSVFDGTAKITNPIIDLEAHSLRDFSKRYVQYLIDRSKG